MDPGAFGAQVGRLDDELAALGRPREQVAVGVHCPVFAWTTAADAWRLVEPHLHYSEWKYADMVAQPYADRADGPSSPPELTDCDPGPAAGLARWRAPSRRWRTASPPTLPPPTAIRSTS